MAYVTVPNAFVNGATSDGPAVTANFTAVTDGLSDGTKDLYVNDVTCEDVVVSGALSVVGAAAVTGTFTASGAFVASGAVSMAQLIPAGTKMIFYQASAPTGWTRDTTAALNDKFIRIVTAGSPGSTGGTHAASTNIGDHTHTGPSHTHGSGTLFACGMYVSSHFFVKQDTSDSWSGTDYFDVTGVSSGGGSKTTGLSLVGSTASGGTGNTGAASVGTGTYAYCDMLIATKD